MIRYLRRWVSVRAARRAEAERIEDDAVTAWLASIRRTA